MSGCGEVGKPGEYKVMEAKRRQCRRREELLTNAIEKPREVRTGKLPWIYGHGGLL